MQCRADATGRLLHRPACGESAFGAAVLAACGASGDRLADVVGRMVRRERSFEPQPQRQAAYDELYQAFCEQLRQRGYR
jgi:sugar (pentulose or hexulose) kinase